MTGTRIPWEEEADMTRFCTVAMLMSGHAGEPPRKGGCAREVEEQQWKVADLTLLARSDPENRCLSSSK